MNNRDFKGVWIPKEIWLNPDLTLVEKCLLVEIDSLDNEHERGLFCEQRIFSYLYRQDGRHYRKHYQRFTKAGLSGNMLLGWQGTRIEGEEK